jgi:hypothetical protein
MQTRRPENFFFCPCACCGLCEVANGIRLQWGGGGGAPNCARRHAHIIAATEIFVYHPHRLAVDLDVAKRQRSQATSVDLLTLGYPGGAPPLRIGGIACATMDGSKIPEMGPRSSPQGETPYCEERRVGRPLHLSSALPRERKRRPLLPVRVQPW